ncbi:histone H1 [Olea europaea subsp. europaea]|uniref:Histone H1 n=1 Tax=Olea europaea subsp. europaea TaxID=158383 RepID=A0A8S0PC76_OLEEU|nr:histone H1 [Olea europaea subsp. europaea]
MSATVEKNLAEEQPQPAEEKTVKEKKPKVPKEKKPKATKNASHPPYFEMIKEALVALNEKSGSSPYAIAKYMEDKHKAVLPANFRKILGLQLKNSAEKGKLMKIKASYKLSEAKPTKKEASGKPKSSAAVKAKKTEGVKKAKKASTAKPKQPKSIKPKRAKRGVA